MKYDQDFIGKFFACKFFLQYIINFFNFSWKIINIDIEFKVENLQIFMNSAELKKHLMSKEIKFDQLNLENLETFRNRYGKNINLWIKYS